MVLNEICFSVCIIVILEAENLNKRLYMCDVCVERFHGRSSIIITHKSM